ncbi:MAG: hypothetical protein WA376_19060, partial [Terrimicrobiaceae bacterium]
FNDGTPIIAVNPFNRIACHGFSCLSLKHEALEIRFAGRTFAVLDLFRPFFSRGSTPTPAFANVAITGKSNGDALTEYG